MMKSVLRAWSIGLALTATGYAQIPAGGEFRANTFTTATQGAPVVAREPDGDFVMAWQSAGQDGDGYGVFGQRYDASGTPRGAEFQINTYTTGDQTRPWLAADGAGRFVVVWNTVNASPDGDGGSVHGQRFAADGSRLGTEFIVNTYTTGDQYWARVAVNRAGTFVVVWQSVQDGSGTSIQAQRYDRDGQKLLGEFQVNLATAGDQVTPDVKMNSLGRMGMVWAGPDGSSSGIFARAFNEFGTPVGVEVVANTVTADTQAFPSLHGARTGDPDDFPSVVAWESFGQDGSDLGVFARQFRGFGAPVGPEFQVNTYATGAQGGQPLAAMDEGGNFVISWRTTAPQDGSGDAVMARRFAASGQPRSPEFLVNTYTTGAQDQAHVAVDPFGNFVVAWRSAGQDGSLSGAFAQRFQGLHARAMDVDATGNGVLDPGETVVARASWQNLSGTAQTFGGNLALLSGRALNRSRTPSRATGRSPTAQPACVPTATRCPPVPCAACSTGISPRSRRWSPIRRDRPDGGPPRRRQLRRTCRARGLLSLRGDDAAHRHHRGLSDRLRGTARQRHDAASRWRCSCWWRRKDRATSRPPAAHADVR